MERLLTERESLLKKGEMEFILDDIFSVRALEMDETYTALKTWNFDTNVPTAFVEILGDKNQYVLFLQCTTEDNFVKEYKKELIHRYIILTDKGMLEIDTEFIKYDEDYLVLMFSKEQATVYLK